MPQIINQNGTVVDLISHGPIEGLVRGAGSIILDGTPINTANVIGSSGSASTANIAESTVKPAIIEIELFANPIVKAFSVVSSSFLM